MPKCKVSSLLSVLIKTEKKVPQKLKSYAIYTLSSNGLQAFNWAFALDGIGLIEALVDCSWSLEKNRIEPGLES